MHPPLGRPHPLCADVVEALMLCHEQNPKMKFFGTCNDAKVALDHCFRAEKEAKRKLNFEQSRTHNPRPRPPMGGADPVDAAA